MMRSESDTELSRSNFQAYGSFHSSAPQDRRRYGRRENQWIHEDGEGPGERRESMLHRAAVPVGIVLLLGIAILAAHSIWTMTTHPQAEPELDAQRPQSTNIEVDAREARLNPPCVLGLRAENEYGENNGLALGLYGLDMVIEPYRETTIRINREIAPESAHHPSSKFFWRMVRADMNGTPLANVEPIMESLGGFHATIELKEPGGYYLLLVRQVMHDGTIAAEGKTTVACKYVRRELRELRAGDLRDFFEAMRIFYTVSIEEGRERYGATFSNYKRIVAYHNSRAFCYHNGMQFLTAHTAFNLAVERSLQMINPKVSLASWDFMIDASKLGTEWHQSRVFGPSMFGSAFGSADNKYQISDGWFANISSILDPNEDLFEDWIMTNHNPYGYVSASHNFLDSPGVARTHSFCGMRGEATFAKCEVFIDCFYQGNTLNEWTDCIESKVHASMHGVIGGGFGCNTNMEKFLEENPVYSRGLLTFTLEYILANKWPGNSMLRKFNTCSQTCEVGQVEPCGCSCQIDPFEMEDENVYELFKPSISMLQNRSGGDQYVHEDPSARYLLSFMQDGERLEDEDNLLLMRMLLKIGCEPGAIGAMSGGASPSDPIFWVIHPVLEKGMHVVMLAPDFRDTYDYAWVNSTCYGSSVNDKLPFTEEMLGMGDSTELLTNAELLGLLNPTNGRLTYMYDSFESWGTCTHWNPCPTCINDPEVGLVADMGGSASGLASHSVPRERHHSSAGVR